MITDKNSFNIEQVRLIGEKLGIDWNSNDLDEFQVGLGVELEHGVRDPSRQITQDDLLFAGKIAWAHLKDNPDYYFRFDRIG